MAKKDLYFYSEGYVYKGVDTYLKVYGAPAEQKKFGEHVAKLLNTEKH